MSTLGNVTCLSGTLIYARLGALLTVFDTYINVSSGRTATVYDHWKHNFGDDRSLTQHLAGTFGHRSTDILTGTISETQPAMSLRSLILQRRRWFLGTAATEAAALCNADLWRGSPLQSAYRLCIKPLAIRDFQMVLLVFANSYLRLEYGSWILPTVALFFLADMTILLSFGVVRRRLGVWMYPFVLLLFHFITSVSSFAALTSSWDRRW